MPFITSKGYIFLIIYTVLILAVKIRRDSEMHVTFDVRAFIEILLIPLLTFIVADWLSNTMKIFIERVRPCNVLKGVNLLAGCTASFSFPSGHAANSCSYAISLVYFLSSHFRKRWLLPPLITAALISFSRVYVGVHYPSDVAGGGVFALIISFAVILLYRASRNSHKKSPYEAILYYSLLVISIFRVYYITAGPLDLSADEALYWDCSRRPELSYYSKGPFVMYVMYVFTHVLGVNVLALRLPAVLFTALSSIYIFKLARLIYGQESGNNCEQKFYEKNDFIGLSSALIFQFLPLYATYGVVFTIDPPFVFFWIISLYLTYKGAVEGQGGYILWILLGFCVGLGLLSKYTMALFYGCALLFFVFSDTKLRNILKTVKPYIALIISLAVFSPVIIWNWQHNWVTLRHTAGHAHVADGLIISPVKFFEFIGSQLGVVTPVILVLMIIAVIRLYKVQRGNESGFLFWFSAPVLVFFLIKSIQGKVQANWPMTGYITALIAFSRYYLYKAQGQPFMMEFKHTRRSVKAALIVAVVVTALSHYPQVLRLPVDIDPTARLRGWRQLGPEVATAYRELKKAGGEILVFSDKYQVAAELAFYVKGNPVVYCVALGRRMNEYDMWPGINDAAAKLRALNGKVRINILFVTDTSGTIHPVVAQSSDNCEQALFNVTERGQILRTYSIFKCYGFREVKDMRPDNF